MSQGKKTRRDFSTRNNFFRNLARVSIIFVLLVLSFLPPCVSFVYAASSPWTQSDWSGGGGQTSWSDTTKFSGASGVSTASDITLQATSSWYDTSWKYRRKITFDNSAQAENLTNFPVLVKLNSSRVNYANTQNSGQDVRFTDSDGTTLLSYEIEKWDESGDSFVWVKVPQIDASSNTDFIYIYYGNSSANDGQAATSVWDSNYTLVQHLKETSGITVEDSTSNNRDGTKLSAAEPNPTTSGQMNGAQTFDGDNDYISIPNTAVNGLTTVTTSFWVKTTEISNQAVVSGARAGASNEYLLMFDSPTVFKLFGRPSNQDFLASWTIPSVSTGAWQQFTVVRNGDTDQASLYINGVLQSTQSMVEAVGALNVSSGGLYIGQDQDSVGGDFDPDQALNGSLDELRISSGVRSAAWIGASYKSEADTFNTYASEESLYSVGSGTLTSSIFDAEQGSNWGSLNYNATVPSNTSVSVKVRTSNSSSMTGATAFSSCTAVTSGSDISSNSCISDTHRYIQYQLTLANSDSISTPTFQDISVAFTPSDTDTPSLSLTPVSPDPTSDTTPTVAGTATESVGTVSTVEFQMDSTAGTWNVCIADDGSFDEAAESFTCTPSSALSDGSHTVYVRATDSNGNTTANGSYATDTFTVDTTPPTPVELDSPGNNSYTSSDRPTFRWKTTADSASSLSKYVLEIDNPSLGNGYYAGDFSIDDIPVSRTSDLETNKYTVHYENFGDSDTTNNYIAVTTKSNNEWSVSANEGKLRQGIVTWRVKVVDTVGSEAISSRVLFVDQQSPIATFTQINNASFIFSNMSTTDRTPTIFGEITDRLMGGDSSQTQSEGGPRIASGPKNVTVTIVQPEGNTYRLITSYTRQLDSPYYTCEPNKVIDNSRQRCDKYLPFFYTPEVPLPFGVYKVVLSGQDAAGNTSSETSFFLTISTIAQLVTSAGPQIIEEGSKDFPSGEKKNLEEKLEITRPTKPDESNKKTQKEKQKPKGHFVKNAGNILTSLVTGLEAGIGFTFHSLESGIRGIFTQTEKELMPLKENIAQFSFNLGEQTQNVSGSLGLAIVKFGYLFVTEPTTISKVNAVALSPTEVKITWQTNHPANGKVNYGLKDGDYTLEQQTDKRTTKHEFVIKNLKPNTQYHYEVMSHNKNYVYDANRKFKTPER